MMLSYLFWSFIPMALPPFYEFGIALIALGCCDAAHPSCGGDASIVFFPVPALTFRAAQNASMEEVHRFD